MAILEELIKELRLFIKYTVFWICSFFGATIFFLAFGLKHIVLFGKHLILPMPTDISVAVQVFRILENKFLPAGVTIIVIDPWSGFITQLEVAMALAFILTLPLLLYMIIGYISPALFEHEKKAIFKSLSLSMTLFLAGCIFAYQWMIPLTFKFMYPFTVVLNITPYFALDAFMSWVICILIATGVTFLLPVFMVTLSFLGIVPPEFWKSKWQAAILILLIFCAVITPDQTGVTMILLFIPLAVLYGAGTVLSFKYKRSKIEV